MAVHQFTIFSYKKGPALHDHSLPAADDWFHIGKSSVNSRNSVSSLSYYRIAVDLFVFKYFSGVL